MRAQYSLIALAGMALGVAACGGSTPSPSATAHAGNGTSTSTTAPGLAAGPYGPPQSAVGSGPTTTAGGAASPTTTIVIRATTTTTLAPARTTTTTIAPTTTTTTTTTTPGQTASSSSTSGGLTVTYSADPSRAAHGTPVQFTIRATESHAPGALVYQLSFGDGASAQNTAPTTCKGGAAGPAQETWQLSHAYTSKGTYFARAVVKANCTPDQTSVTLTITIS